MLKSFSWAVRAAPSLAPSRNNNKFFCLQRFEIADNSAFVYIVPSSVELDRYTILGCTICSSVW